MLVEGIHFEDSCSTTRGVGNGETGELGSDESFQIELERL